MRVLILEDSEADAELMLYELRRSGIEVEVRRTEDEAGFMEGLDEAPDVILADYNLPQFSGMQALEALQRRRLDIPFILVTGGIGEETAVAALRDGVTDYLLKDRLTRLGAAVMHALEQRKIRAGKARAEASLRQLSGRLMQAQDEERRRIARELHDSTAQKLSALTLVVERIGQLMPGGVPEMGELLEETDRLAREALRELRDISYLLHPPLLDEAGLDLALRWFVDGFSKRTGIVTTLDITSPTTRLPQEAEIAIFRVVQESLANIHRHSGSPTAAILLEADAEMVALEVRDCGCGFGPDAMAGEAVAPGVGLPGIRERVRQLGGECTIRSGDAGTILRVTLPMEENDL